MTEKPRPLNQFVTALQRRAELDRQDFREAIDHPGEKGDAFESIISRALAKLLPKRFSLGDGFLFNAHGDISRQTDIVIYDEQNNLPLQMSPGNALQFPVECVFATIEVKSSLDSTTLDDALDAVMQIRRVGREKFYTVGRRDFTVTTPPRSYIVAFDQSGLGTNYAEFQAKLIELLAKDNRHIHGVCILSKNWFAGRRAFRNPPELFGREGNGLMQLYEAILSHQRNFEIFPMNVRAYIGGEETEGQEK